MKELMEKWDGTVINGQQVYQAHRVKILPSQCMYAIQRLGAG